MKIKISAIC